MNSDRSYTGTCGSFAEYRVRIRKIALKIPPSKKLNSLQRRVMKNLDTLSTKLTAFAAALAMNGLVMGALGYLFVLQSFPNMSVIAFAKAVVAHQVFVLLVCFSYPS
jgi:hypothetical protein